MKTSQMTNFNHNGLSWMSKIHTHTEFRHNHYDSFKSTHNFMITIYLIKTPQTILCAN